MKLRFPIYAKIISWFFLNLLVMALIVFAFVKWQFQQGFDSLLLNSARQRLQRIERLVSDELIEKRPAQWNEVLERFSEIYGVKLFLFRNDGRQLAGNEIDLPREVFRRLNERVEERSLRGGAPDRRGVGPGPDAPPPGGRGRGGRGGVPPFMVRTTDPDYYWVGLRTPVPDDPSIGMRPAPAILFIRSESLLGEELYFDLKPWITMGTGFVLFSILFWILPVRDLTRSISRLTRATEQIAQGKFDTRIESRRRDELGRLSEAVNTMAQRLHGFVSGQKRFSGDIAHELCAPLARIQMSLGILEQRADESLEENVSNLHEDVQEMSSLVNELLSFSKASLGQGALNLSSVNVNAIAEEVIHREAQEDAAIQNHLPDNLEVLADPELLKRALANLIRNAVRYAGNAGPVTLSVTQDNDSINILVTDSGPGVPEADLPKLFDPFYRTDTARARETGGTGLGLAIVKTCIESCGGTVACRNRQSHGLEVIVVLSKKKN